MIKLKKILLILLLIASILLSGCGTKYDEIYEIKYDMDSCDYDNYIERSSEPEIIICVDHNIFREKIKECKFIINKTNDALIDMKCMETGE